MVYWWQSHEENRNLSEAVDVLLLEKTWRVKEKESPPSLPFYVVLSWAKEVPPDVQKMVTCLEALQTNEDTCYGICTF